MTGELTKNAWQATAAKVMRLLLDRSNVDLASNFDEIVIVPDGFLWYLPFEALPVGSGDNPQPLIARARVRYAPTVGLAVPYNAVRKPRPNVGVVVGKLHPQDEAEVAQAAFDELAPAVTGAVSLPRKLEGDPFVREPAAGHAQDFGLHMVGGWQGRPGCNAQQHIGFCHGPSFPNDSQMNLPCFLPLQHDFLNQGSQECFLLALRESTIIPQLRQLRTRPFPCFLHLARQPWNGSLAIFLSLELLLGAAQFTQRFFPTTFQLTGH